MDAMDILGSLLGRKTQSSGRGADILKDILGGGSASRRPPQPQTQPTDSRRTRPPQTGPRTIGDAAQSLEDLLNVSNDHHVQRHQAPQRSAPPQPSVVNDEMNEQAEILVRAMINAAKSDGQIDRAEQDEILRRMDPVGQSESEFLRQEFARPLDVREFTWTVPLGMEEQVYAISLLAIDLDENREANYLGDLARGLRLDPKRCNEIHRKYQAPVIFRE